MKIPAIISLQTNRVWRTYTGGKTLDQLENKPAPQDTHFAENWIASTTQAVNKGREEYTDEGFSKVFINGNEYLLKELMEQFPIEIPGEAHYKKYGANTQFLLKFLDSAIRLHIQAHPTIPFAQKFLGSNSGKTEAYVILGVRPEVTAPYIYLGFQHAVDKAGFRQAVLQQNTEEILAHFDKIYIRPGDVFFVPGGLPHAIGEGVFMIEIMEPTDFVVRLEFERGGYVLPEAARFMGRDVDFALSMIEFRPLSVEEVRQKYFCKPQLIKNETGVEEYILIGSDQTPCFSVRKLKVKRSYIRSYEGFHVGIVINGQGNIEAGKEIITIKKGDTFLIPYQTKEVKYTSSEELEIVFAFPPK